MIDLRIGDWITQYSSGYWQIFDIKPNYASSNDKDHEKGELLGYHILCKKAFTTKMKPRIMVEWVHSDWCNKVDKDTENAILACFEENPKFYQKFMDTPNRVNPAIMNIWLSVPTEEEHKITTFLEHCPKRINDTELSPLLREYGLSEYVNKRLPATHLMNFLFYPWDMDENYNLFLSEPECKKFDDAT